MIEKILGFIGGYYDSDEFELDIPKIADISELSEEQVIQELEELQKNKDITIVNNIVTLHNIVHKKSKKFNNLYAPVETIYWTKGMKLVLDK